MHSTSFSFFFEICWGKSISAILRIALLRCWKWIFCRLSSYCFRGDYWS